MRQLSKHDVNRATALELEELLPFQITNDGEVIAMVLPANDVNKLDKKPKASHDVNIEMPFSKAAQVEGIMGRQCATGWSVLNRRAYGK